MEIYYDKKENYVEIKDYIPETPEAGRDFWRGVTEKYPGCAVDLVYNNIDAPEEFLREIGAALLDACTEMRLRKENFTPLTGKDSHGDFAEVAAKDDGEDSPTVITKDDGEDSPTVITKDNFENFAKQHDAVNPDMYWNSERIKADLSRWRIYRSGTGYIMLSLWADPAEIFALETEINTEANCNAAADRNANADGDTDAISELLSLAAGYAFETGKKGVLWMVDDNLPRHMDAALKTGFEVCGRSAGYRVPVYQGTSRAI